MAIVTVQLVSILYAGNCRSQHSIQQLLSCGSAESLVSILFYTVLFLVNVVCGARATKFLVDTSQALHELVFYIDAHHCHVDLARCGGDMSRLDVSTSGNSDLKLNPARSLPRAGAGTADSTCHSSSGCLGCAQCTGSAAGDIHAEHSSRMKFLRGLADYVQRDPGPSLFDLVRISPNALFAMLVYVVATGLSLFYKQVFHTT